MVLTAYRHTALPPYRFQPNIPRSIAAVTAATGAGSQKFRCSCWSRATKRGSDWIARSFVG